MSKSKTAWITDLFLEYLIAGIASALGELLVTRIGKWIRKKWKQCKTQR